MVKAREDQLGPITVLDENGDGYVTATGAQISGVSAIVYDEVGTSPGNNAIWVDGYGAGDSLPKFTNSAGTSFTLGEVFEVRNSPPDVNSIWKSGKLRLLFISSVGSKL